MSDQVVTKNTGTAVVCRNIDGTIIPGLCLKSLTWKAGSRSEKEGTCSGKKESMTRYGVYQEVSAEAVIRKAFYDDVDPKLFVLGDFIDFADEELDQHYLALMATTDAAAPAITDSYEVADASATKSEEEEWTLSVTFRRDPDFQPAP